MPTRNLWRLAEVTLKQVRKTKYQVAVLPFGATEPHNLHLPYATDNYEVEAICDRACAWAWKRGARVALLPGIPFGCDQNLMEFPMTVSVDQEQLDGIVASVARSLEHHGVTKLVVVNGHGGNNFQPGLRTLFGRSKVFCCLVNWYQMMSDEGGKIFESPGEHADEMESSLVLALRPDLVEMAWADDGGTFPSRFEAGRRGWAWYPRPWERVTKNSGFGDPRKASAAKGRRYLALCESRFGQFLVELARAPRDKAFPFDRSHGAGHRGRAGGGHA